MNNEPVTVDGDDALTVRGLQEQGKAWTQADSRLRRLRLLFRGNYVWLCLVVLTFAVVGAIVGYGRVELLYRSEGLIRIKPYLSAILYRTEQAGVMPMFDQYVGAQITLIQSPRVRRKAMEHEQWRSLGRGASPEAEDQFRRSLEVRQGRSSHIIRIAYVDPKPGAAQMAVQAVVEAYMRIYGESETEEQTTTLRILNERQARLTSELGARENQIGQIAEAYGPDALETMFEYKLWSLHEFKIKLTEKELALAEMERGPVDDPQDQRAEADEQPTVPDELPIDQIAAVEPAMRTLVDHRDWLRDNLTAMAQLEFSDAHKQVIPLKVSLAHVEQQIAALAKTFNDRRQARGAGGMPSDPRATVRGEIEQLRREAQQMWKLLEQTKAEAEELGRQNAEIKELKKDAERFESQLDETRERIDQLLVESRGSNRIEVISRGDLPVFPFNKAKRRRAAMIDAACGAAVGIGLILIIGLLADRTPWELDLSHTHVADAELVRLKELPGLAGLFLAGTPVTDGGLVHLEGLKQLEHLDLRRTAITDVGLVHLKGLPRLAEINLSDTQVTEAGLVLLKQLACLKRLNLSGTQMTDAGLEYLEGLRHLEFVDLGRTQVTEAGLDALEQALPHVEVEY